MLSLCAALLSFFTTDVFAQAMPTDEGYFFENLGPDELIIPIPKGGVLVESVPIENVIEGVGTIAYSSVPIYATASKKSKVIRYAIPGEKMIISATYDEWYAVRMYDGSDAFVEKRNMKTVKVFYDESVTTNRMDKRLNYDLRDTVDTLNTKLATSNYLKKYKIIPRLTIVSTSMKDNKMIVTMEYSAVDDNGAVIPSKQENRLNKEMVKFVEILFMKMLPSKSLNYTITIKTPKFSPEGRVLSTQDTYAELYLDGDKIEEKYIPSSKSELMVFIKSSIPMEDLFKEYPN